MKITEDVTNTKQRCHRCNLNNPLYVAYHDTEWGVPVAAIEHAPSSSR